MNFIAQLFLLVTVALMAQEGHALAPSANNSRRAFLSKVATTSAATVVTTAAVASPAFAKGDAYDLTGVDEIVVKKEKESSKSGSGGLLVGGALGGGLLLSLPFFYQNLARMAGIKNSKIK